MGTAHRPEVRRNAIPFVAHHTRLFAAFATHNRRIYYMGRCILIDLRHHIQPAVSLYLMTKLRFSDYAQLSNLTDQFVQHVHLRLMRETSQSDRLAVTQS